MSNEHPKEQWQVDEEDDALEAFNNLEKVVMQKKLTEIVECKECCLRLNEAREEANRAFQREDTRLSNLLNEWAKLQEKFFGGIRESH